MGRLGSYEVGSISRSRNDGRGGSHKSHFIALTISLSRAGRRRGRRAGSSGCVAATGLTGLPRRFAPTFAARNGRPAVRLVRVEILNRWRGGVVPYGIIGAVEVKWQGRVVLRIGFLVVGPLLMLGCLSPYEVVGQGRLRKPVVCVGGLNEALRSDEMLVEI